MAQLRLNKFISECGISSRRKAEEFIKQGRVTVNDTVIDQLSFRVDPEKDTVRLDGEKIKLKEYVYFLLNKPKGFVTTTSDEKKRNTVLELIKTSEKVYPVGRLDFNTTGVLLLTNDGNLTHVLTHPRNHVPRVYEVKLNKPLMDEDKDKLQKGIFIEGGKGRFSKINFPGKGNKKHIEVTGHEGRNHFVKKMFSSLGYMVQELNRLSFAGIQADIPVGSYRELTPDEVKLLKKYAG